MFNWELVTISSTGVRNTVDEWSTKTIDNDHLKMISNFHAVEGRVSLIYVSFDKFEDTLCMVTGKRPALAALGYPKKNWDLV